MTETLRVEKIIDILKSLKVIKPITWEALRVRVSGKMGNNYLRENEFRSAVWLLADAGHLKFVEDKIKTAVC